MAKKATKTGKELERRVADAYRAMGACRVEHDVELAGNQIDVYVELKTTHRRFLHRIAVEVKDWSKPVGIDIINDFAKIVKLLRSERLIDEGVIVSAAGFSKPARNAVRTYSIQLLEPADLEAMVEEPKGVKLPQSLIVKQSDAVNYYLVESGEKRRILDNPTLSFFVKLLGVKEIPEWSSKKLSEYNSGDVLESRAPRIVQNSQGIRYLVAREEKRQIPNDETLRALGGDPRHVPTKPDEYLARFREGSPLPEEWGQQWFTSDPKFVRVDAAYTAVFLVCGPICRYIYTPACHEELGKKLQMIGPEEGIDEQELERYVEGISIRSERDVQTVLLQLCARGSGGTLVRD